MSVCPSVCPTRPAWAGPPPLPAPLRGPQQGSSPHLRAGLAAPSWGAAHSPHLHYLSVLFPTGNTSGGGPALCLPASLILHVPRSSQDVAPQSLCVFPPVCMCLCVPGVTCVYLRGPSSTCPPHGGPEPRSVILGCQDTENTPGRETRVLNPLMQREESGFFLETQVCTAAGDRLAGMLRPALHPPRLPPPSALPVSAVLAPAP